MSATSVDSVETAPGAPRAAGDSGLRRRQVLGILRLELKKNLLSRRAFAMYLLAFGPLFFALIRLLLAWRGVEMESPVEAGGVFSQIFELYLRVSIFFSTAFLFLNLFRSEVQDRSLHYYLLTPVRREVLVIGKFVSALVASCAVFLVSTSLLYLLVLVPGGMGDTMRYLTSGPGLGHLLGYLGIMVLACAGYGAVFLFLGLLGRNPLMLALLFWGWETISFILPPLLKKLTVTHYLQSLYPIPLPEKLISVLAEPTPVWLSVPTLLLFTFGVLTLAGLKARRMEVSYGGD